MSLTENLSYREPTNMELTISSELELVENNISTRIRKSAFSNDYVIHLQEFDYDVRFKNDPYLMNMKTTFLYKDLKDDVYMHQSKGFQSQEDSHLDCKAKIINI